MDAINKNFPVGQPDDNGNYEWMLLRAGGGVSSTGDVEIQGGDLEMNGGDILNCGGIENGSAGASTWLLTPPLNYALTPNFNSGTSDIFQPALYNQSYCRPEPDLVTTVPYAEIVDGGNIRINEEGLYRIDMSLAWKRNGNLDFRQRGLTCIIHEGPPPNDFTDEIGRVIGSPATEQLFESWRQGQFFIKVLASELPKTLGLTWTCSQNGPVLINYQWLGNIQGDFFGTTSINVTKISDDVTPLVPLVP